MQFGNRPPSSFSQYLAGSSGTRLPVALRKVAHRWCNALAQYAFELPLLIRTRSCMQRWGGFGVLRVTGEGTMGGKQDHMDSFFLAQPVLFDIMYLEKLLSAVRVTSSAAWWNWEGFWTQQSVSPGHPLFVLCLILNTFPCPPQNQYYWNKLCGSSDFVLCKWYPVRQQQNLYMVEITEALACRFFHGTT